MATVQDQTAEATEQAKRKRGAPAGNRNRLTSGRFAFLATGRYPRGAGYVGRLLCGLRRALSAEVEAIHGEINLHKAALILSVIRHEGRALLAQRELRTSESLTMGDRQALRDEIGAATEARDRCLKALKLDRTVDRTSAYLDALSAANGRQDQP